MSLDQMRDANVLALVHCENKNFFGNPFYEFKLLLSPEVTLHFKVAFGKKKKPSASGGCLKPLQ